MNKNEFQNNYIAQLYTYTMSTPYKYKPTFSTKKPIKDVKENDVKDVKDDTDNIILYQSQPHKKSSHHLTGALSGTYILFSNSKVRKCSRRRRL
jgi:hypothetical protein